MSRRYRVTHRTTYHYGQAVTDGYSVACLLPRDRPGQRVIESGIVTDPAANEFTEITDMFDNRVAHLAVHVPHERFEIVSESLVECDVAPMPSTTISWEEAAAVARALRGPDLVAVGPYLATTQASAPARRSDLLSALTSGVFTPARPLVEALVALSTAIFTTYSFDPAATDWTTPLDTVLEQQRGVCQDFAHLATAALRSVGLPASYVSGYIETEPPPGEEKSIGADASHAWCSAWIPGHGWLDLDPTNDQVPPSRHVTVAWGRDYADVAPVRGVVLGPAAEQSMDIGVDVVRL